MNRLPRRSPYRCPEQSNERLGRRQPPLRGRAAAAANLSGKRRSVISTVSTVRKPLAATPLRPHLASVRAEEQPVREKSIEKRPVEKRSISEAPNFEQTIAAKKDWLRFWNTLDRPWKWLILLVAISSLLAIASKLLQPVK